MERPGYQAPLNKYNTFTWAGFTSSAVSIESWLQQMVDHATNNPGQWLTKNYNMATDDIVKRGPAELYDFLLGWLQGMCAIYPHAQGTEVLEDLATKYAAVIQSVLLSIPAAPWGSQIDAFRVGGWPGSVWDQWIAQFQFKAAKPAVLKKVMIFHPMNFWPIKRGK